MTEVTVDFEESPVLPGLYIGDHNYSERFTVRTALHAESVVFDSRRWKSFDYLEDKKDRSLIEQAQSETNPTQLLVAAEWIKRYEEGFDLVGQWVKEFNSAARSTGLPKDFFIDAGPERLRFSHLVGMLEETELLFQNQYQRIDDMVRFASHGHRQWELRAKSYHVAESKYVLDSYATFIDRARWLAEEVDKVTRKIERARDFVFESRVDETPLFLGAGPEVVREYTMKDAVTDLLDGSAAIARDRLMLVVKEMAEAVEQQRAK